MIWKNKQSVLGAILMVVLSVLTGCADPEPEITLEDRVDQLQDELVGGGVSSDVADCVTRLAEYDLRSADLDPIALDELKLNCERAERILDDDGLDDDQSLAFAEGPHTLGDDPELDRLWAACADGSGQACDDLFQQSPVGSEYERFGVSCGDRDGILDCRELDEGDETDDAAG
jgi:hypothetical protein